MRKVPSPCLTCQVNEENPKCHSDCKKYKAFIKINREVKRRIGADIRKSNRMEYKPVLQAICAKNRK